MKRRLREGQSISYIAAAMDRTRDTVRLYLFGKKRPEQYRRNRLLRAIVVVGALFSAHQALAQNSFSITVDPPACSTGAATPSCSFKVTVTLGTPTISLATITIPAVVPAGQPIAITVDGNPSPGARDWVMIASCTAAGACEPDNGPIGGGLWVYLNGTESAPAAPVPLPATVSLPGVGEGYWEARYLANDQTTVLARAGFISRANHTITVTPNPIQVPDRTAKGATIALWSCVNDDGSKCPSVSMTNSAGGVFVLVNNTIVVDPNGPGLPPIASGSQSETLTIQLATTP